MRKRWATWITVGTILVVGVAASAQQGRWVAQGDKTAQTAQTAQSLIKMERQWAEADCDGNLALQTILADDFQGTAPDGSLYRS
jgi:uncharacterized protein YpmB